MVLRIYNLNVICKKNVLMLSLIFLCYSVNIGQEKMSYATVSKHSESKEHNTIDKKYYSGINNTTKFSTRFY